MGVQFLLLLGLGCHFKQAGDEGDLRQVHMNLKS